MKEVKEVKASGWSDKKIEAIMKGEVPPPSEVVGYLVRQYQESKENFKSLEAAIKDMEARLVQARRQLLVQQGATNKYVDDVRYFLEMEEQLQDNQTNKGRSK